MEQYDDPPSGAEPVAKGFLCQRKFGLKRTEK